MKKIIFLFLVSLSTITLAQESVKLRYNYKQGDVYKFSMELKQNMGIMGGMNMIMNTLNTVEKSDSQATVMKGKVDYMSMNMMQAGQTMSFNSDMKDEELDAAGKQMKAQMDPVLKAVTTITFDSYGKVTKVVTEPTVPGAEKQAALGYTYFPEEAVKVGSTWNNETDLQGMKINMVFTVKEITASEVKVDVGGKLNGMGTTTDLSGKAQFDKATGNTNFMNVKASMDIQGASVTMDMTMKSEKSN